MRLVDLIGSALEGAPDPALEITGLTSDSRAVKQGFLFAALPGVHQDGAHYIKDALERGAAVILATPAIAAKCAREGHGAGAKLLTDINPRRQFASLTARYYGAQPETIIAVTGTNGKTSVADFCRQIWTRLARRAASIGTLGIQGAGADETQGGAGHVHTTPPPEILYPALARLNEAGVTHVAIEASSHGLAQYRLDGVRLAAAALTNITRDHMDYHDNLAGYVYAKLRLFGEVLPPGGVAVLNREDASYSEAEALSWARGHRIISVGGRYGDLRIVHTEPHARGQRLRIAYEMREWEVELPLLGRFQALNALTAVGLVIGCGEDPDDVFGALPELHGAPGRLEVAGETPDGASILVDYAHTPEALRTVLEALRPFCKGRLHLLFGCGGDRDRGKRPLMGAVARELADLVVITDDNPRSEEPAAIRAAILAACSGATEIADRARAIRFAVANLLPGDMLVVAGKGHESGQEIAGVITPFDDRQEVVRAIGESVRQEDRHDGG
ncbi:MAG: UDP-N-acetylmuramoyl-L-alanyl-D-glutamate--2,6-diaminopimelate ligase [Alphaproteobacteria bacterium]|nr:UDP-N-acetylmuramoyl-L-alanyl-D-glutamate--2,6-diaminopimelate ligase [Alphaproteobacteria bacterium]